MNENIFVSGYENIFQEGLNAYARGRYKRAIYYFEKANKESKNNFSCLYNLGLAHQSANNVEQAIEYCKTRIAALEAVVAARQVAVNNAKAELDAAMAEE